MLKAALCGGYVNFGVFSLYGDVALENCLNIFVKLLTSIPQSNLLVSTLLLSLWLIPLWLFLLLSQMFAEHIPELPHFNLAVGIPQTKSVVLRSPGNPCTGSHEVS